MKRNQKNFYQAVSILAVFAIWTVLVCTVDINAIGPQGSNVGFATVNGFVHELTGVHMLLYTVTDWLGLIPCTFVSGFAALGLLQWIKRKSLFKVDFDILVLGIFYIVVFTIYFLFEIFIVNYRPILIEGRLEASYPSSTTVLVMCVMLTSAAQFKIRIKNIALMRVSLAIIYAFVIFAVTARFVSGVHWFTDIVGGILLSAGLVKMYRCVI